MVYDGGRLMNVNNLGYYDSYQIKMFLMILESILRNGDTGYFSLNNKENIFRLELVEVDKKGNPLK